MPILRRLIGYVWRYRGPAALSVLLSGLITILYVGSIGSLKPIGDILFEEDGIEKLLSHAAFQTDWGQPIGEWLRANVLVDRTQALLWMCSLILCLSILRNLCRFLQNYLTMYVTNSAIRDITNELHEKVERLSIRHFGGEEGIADTISRFTSDVLILSTGVKNIFNKAILEPMKLIGALVLALALNVKLTLIVLIVLPPLGVLIGTFGRRVKKRVKKSLARRADMLGVLAESFTGIQVVQAFQLEEAQHRRYQDINQRYFKNEMRIARLDSMTSPLVETLTLMAVVGIIYYSASLVLQGQMTSGDFFTFYAALGSLFDPVRKMAKLYNKLNQAIGAGERVFSLYDTPPEIVDAPGAVDLPPFTQEIRFEKLFFHYKEEEPVLQGIHLVVTPGERIGLVGRSGQGKSTLVKLLPRFYDPTEGAIQIDGHDLRSVTLASLRKKIGMVTQDVVLFNTTIAENIRFGRLDATDAEVEEAARQAYVHEFVSSFSQGYQTPVGGHGITLSGGQKQRISIARAILKNPEILILDEAMSSLDTESEKLIQEALEEFMRGRTSFVIAHRLSTIIACDRILVLEGGRIDAMGTHAELLETCPTYSVLNQQQGIFPGG
ncbi:MAG: ABC transporter ATP-binding protein [Planctomycetota bacterium]|nr:ABC transporter ATP-binding protein [Planctomycetota bacterium]